MANAKRKAFQWPGKPGTGKRGETISRSLKPLDLAAQQLDTAKMTMDLCRLRLGMALTREAQRLETDVQKLVVEYTDKEHDNSYDFTMLRVIRNSGGGDGKNIV